MEDAGLTFETAENGQEVLEKASQQDWQVLLTDVQIPLMDGYTATRILRERGNSKPIYALTAHAMQTAIQECLNSGFDAVLTKPIDF